MRIEIGSALNHLYEVSSAEPMDKYLVACASVQFWADLIAAIKKDKNFVAKKIKVFEEQLCLSESDADHAAHALLDRTVLTSKGIRRECSISFTLNKNILPDVLSKVLHLPMPECCGYDLADLELIAYDAKKLSLQVGLGRAFLIVGIRTGGVYLAPFWKAALGNLGVTNVHWCTTRPTEDNTISDSLNSGLAWLKQWYAPVVVVVDDRPDTGITMMRVAKRLFNFHVDLWFSSIGNLWRSLAAPPITLSTPACVTHEPRVLRLWECLLPDKHSKFMARLRAIPGIPPMPVQARLNFRCSQNEVRYGFGRAWLPWNDPEIINKHRSLVNPRKTPVEILGSDNRILLHLHFIGEGVFGRAEFERVREMNPVGMNWLVDGYLITVDIGFAQSFSAKFYLAKCEERTDLLRQAANWLMVPASKPIAHTYDSPLVFSLERRWSRLAHVMRERCSCDSLFEVSGPLSVFMLMPVSWPGREGIMFRSSLPYSCGGWHWQVDLYGRLHRFQLDANWGGISFSELEVAVFILDNNLNIEHAERLAFFCNLSWSSIQSSLSLAVLTILESRVHGVRKLSNTGRISFCKDFNLLIRTVSNLSGSLIPLWE